MRKSKTGPRPLCINIICDEKTKWERPKERISKKKGVAGKIKFPDMNLRVNAMTRRVPVTLKKLV